jgi:type I restriction enzyme, S subunit
VSALNNSARLSDVCRFQNGGTPSKAIERYFTGDIPWITGADLIGPIALQARSFITEEAIASSATNQVPAGTVLLVTRTSVGKVAITGMNLCFSQDITALTPDAKKLSAEYLVHFLRTKQDHFTKHARGATIQGITREVVADLEIPLPPMEEQRRIAAILDQAETLRTQRRQARAHLDTLTQSLFLDMFGNPVENERGWQITSVSDFVAGFESGKSLVADDEDDSSSAFRVLKVSAVTSLEYKPEQSKAVPSNYMPPKSHIVRAGDLLFSRANTTELIGATAFVAATPDNLLLPDKLWRFVWHQPTRTAPLYVRHLFQQPKFRQEIGQRASGTSGSMKNISQEKVLTIRVGHPPLPLQQTFATRIAAIEALKATHRSALAQLDALFASLQQRAFAGEL